MRADRGMPRLFAIYIIASIFRHLSFVKNLFNYEPCYINVMNFYAQIQKWDENRLLRSILSPF